MDDRSFDRLARLLGEARDRRTGLKALVGGMIGAGGLAALDLDADAKRKGRGDDRPAADRRKKKKKKCDPACAAGFTCAKGQCTCASGVACGNACCGADQVCRNGACSDPLPACLPFGEECKNAGRRCCDGLTCASGQDGSFPVTCLRSKGAACASTDECPFGMRCTDGRCLGNGGGGVPTGAACANGETCAQPGATCTAYTGSNAPAGDHCTLPLRKVCSGDPDCSCYKCWYVNGGAQGAGRAGRASTSTKGCCHTSSLSCTSDDDCCYGLTCTGGVCGGTMCVPAGGACADGTCCTGLTCQGGVCAGGGGGSKQLGDACTNADTCPTGSTCVAYAAGSGGNAGTYCLLPDGDAATNRTHCVGKAVDLDGKCRTCTVYHGTQTDDAAFTALKAAIETGTANPVYVGTGLYKPATTSIGVTLITASRGTQAEPLQILACLDADARPIIDGGATVTKTAGGAILDTDNARDLTWANDGTRIMDIASQKYVEIVGIDFQNGQARSSNETGSGGALFVATQAFLTLKSLTIRRSKATQATSGYGGGAIYLTWASGPVYGSATLENVTITQCYAATAGAIYNIGSLVIQGAADKRTTLSLNYGGSYGGAIYANGYRTDVAHTDIKDNIATSESGAIHCTSQEGNGIVLTDVLIENNSALSSAGFGTGGAISLRGCGRNYNGSTHTKNLFDGVTIQNNQAGNGPGAIYIYHDAATYAPIEFKDSLVTGNKSLNWTGTNGSDAYKVNGAYSRYGSTNTSITCTRTAGGDTFTGNGGYDCSTNGTQAFPSGCCATTTPCSSKAICNGTCCTSSPDATCVGTGTGPYSCPPA